MPVVVGIRIKIAGKIYHFDPAGLELEEGDSVLAQTSRGVEFGQVVEEPREVPEEEIVSPLKPLLRKATSEDLEQEDQNRVREKEASEICLRKIEKHGLPMKLIDVEYTFDRGRIIFYFAAEGRVDFRALVRDLAASLKTRIELHQVGVRDEAKIVGGIGPCGRPLCCASFLAKFDPVGIKMAKEQGLSLNPLKISGVCGRLMCCLNFEHAYYQKVKQRLPKVGSQVVTPRGEGKVVGLNVPKETVMVSLSEDAQSEFPASEVKLADPAGRRSSESRTPGR